MYAKPVFVFRPFAAPESKKVFPKKKHHYDPNLDGYDGAEDGEFEKNLRLVVKIWLFVYVNIY